MNSDSPIYSAVGPARHSFSSSGPKASLIWWSVGPDSTGVQLLADDGKPMQTFAGPETRSLNEHCLGSIGYPPLMAFIFLSIPTKIMQLADEHSVAGPRTLGGSSTGRCEDCSLMITSTHFSEDYMLRIAIPFDYIIGANAIVTKRFTPVSEAALHYEFTVSDSDYHSNPWRGEFTMQRNIDALWVFLPRVQLQHGGHAIGRPTRAGRSRS